MIGRLGALAVVLLSGCISSQSGGGERTVTTRPGDDAAQVEVEAVDVGFRPERIAVPAGRVTLRLVEAGSLPHTLVVDGVEAPALEVDRSEPRDEVVLVLEPGEHTFYCDVPGHRAQGMEGALVVR